MYLTVFLAALHLGIAQMAYGATSVSENPTSCLSDAIAADTDYFPSKATVLDNDKGVQFTYSKSYKKLMVPNSATTFLPSYLSLCDKTNASKYTPTEADAGAATVFIPPANVGVDTVDALSALAILGKLDSVIAVNPMAVRPADPCVVQSSKYSPKYSSVADVKKFIDTGSKVNSAAGSTLQMVLASANGDRGYGFSSIVTDATSDAAKALTGATVYGSQDLTALPASYKNALYYIVSYAFIYDKEADYLTDNKDSYYNQQLSSYSAVVAAISSAKTEISAIDSTIFATVPTVAFIDCQATDAAVVNPFVVVAATDLYYAQLASDGLFTAAAATTIDLSLGDASYSGVYTALNGVDVIVDLCKKNIDEATFKASYKIDPILAVKPAADIKTPWINGGKVNSYSIMRVISEKPLSTADDKDSAFYATQYDVAKMFSPAAVLLDLSHAAYQNRITLKNSDKLKDARDKYYKTFVLLKESSAASIKANDKSAVCLWGSSNGVEGLTSRVSGPLAIAAGLLAVFFTM